MVEIQICALKRACGRDLPSESVIIVLHCILLGHDGIVEGVVHFVEVLLAIGLDLKSLQVDILVAVDSDDKLAFDVLFGELR